MKKITILIPFLLLFTHTIFGQLTGDEKIDESEPNIEIGNHSEVIVEDEPPVDFGPAALRANYNNDDTTSSTRETSYYGQQFILRPSGQLFGRFKKHNNYAFSLTNKQEEIIMYAGTSTTALYTNNKQVFAATPNYTVIKDYANKSAFWTNTGGRYVYDRYGKIGLYVGSNARTLYDNSNKIGFYVSAAVRRVYDKNNKIAVEITDNARAIKAPNGGSLFNAGDAFTRVQHGEASVFLQDDDVTIFPKSSSAYYTFNENGLKIDSKYNGQAKIVFDKNGNSSNVNTRNVALRFNRVSGTPVMELAFDGVAAWENEPIMRLSCRDHSASDNTPRIGTFNGTWQALQIELTRNSWSDNWPDYVFDKDYELMPLSEVESFIEENKHLPNVKSADQINQEGKVNVEEQLIMLLEKVEELTLYTIDQEKKIEELTLKLNDHDKE